MNIECYTELPCHPFRYQKSTKKRQILYIVIHYTGNNKDTAKGNASFFHSNATKKTSAHYFVDENSIWQSVPDEDIAYAVGTTGKYYSSCRNSNSISIEMCNSLCSVPQKVKENTINLCLYLMGKYGVPLSRVIRHYDVTHKKCPAPFVEYPLSWNNFKKELESRSDNVTKEQITELIEDCIAEKKKLPEPPWAKQERVMQKAKELGISDGTAPQGLITRAECLAMIERALALK